FRYLFPDGTDPKNSSKGCVHGSPLPLNVENPRESSALAALPGSLSALGLVSGTCSVLSRLLIYASSKSAPAVVNKIVCCSCESVMGKCTATDRERPKKTSVGGLMLQLLEPSIFLACGPVRLRASNDLMSLGPSKM